MTSLLPKVRFTSFSDEWTSSIIKNETSYVDYRGKTPKKVNSGVLLITAKNIKEGFIDYQASAEFIEPSDYDNVMSRGKPKIGDVLFTTEAPLGNVAQVDREDIALAQRVIKFDGKNSVKNDFLKQYFLSAPFRKKLDQKSIGSTVKGIKGSELHKMEIVFPSTNEQQKIADFLSSVDKKISLLKEKHILLTQYKKGVMQKLFKQEIRFKDDNGNDFPDWQTIPLSKLASKNSVKNKDESVNAVLTNSAKDGIVNQGDYFKKDIANQQNLGGYTVVEKNDFVYNPRISELAPVGPIKRNHIGQGVMSPLYTVFRFKDDSLLDYLELYFNTTMWYRYMHSIANFGARHDRMNITTSDFYALPLPIPSENERVKIVSFVNALEVKVSAVKQQIELTQTFKKGLLQQMFV